MTRWLKGLRFARLLVVLITPCIIAKKLYTNLTGVNSITCLFDSALSGHVQDSITQFLNEHKNLAYRGSNLFGALQAQFPFVSNISIDYKKTQHPHVCIETAQPIAAINHDYVVTTDGAIVPKQLFNLHGIELINIAMQLDSTQSLSVDSAFGHVLQALPQEVFSAYNIAWQNNFNVWLQNKKQPNFFMLFGQHQLPTQKVVDACSTIKNFMIYADEKRDLSLKNVVFDTRFENQIVVFEKSKKGAPWLRFFQTEL